MNTNKNLKVEETFNLAIKNHQENKTDIARELYNQVLKINPEFSAAHYNLGVLFKELGENQRAKDCYEKAIEINPNFVDAHYNLGLIFKRLNNYQKSKFYFETVIGIDPNYINAHKNLGVIFRNLGDFQKAINSYKNVIKIDRNQVDAYNNLGIIHADLGELKKAKNIFKKGIEIDPNNINLINNLSILLSKSIFSDETENDRNDLKKLFLFLFKKNNIKHSNIIRNAKSILFTNIEQNQLLEIVNTNSFLTNKILKKVLMEELFHLMLQKSLLISNFLEKLLTKIRSDIIFTLNSANQNILNENFNFIISLAEQCWLNEFIYTQSKKETNQIKKLKQKIEDDKAINELEISILSCYVPLNDSEIIANKLLTYTSSNILFNDLINVQIKEPLREKELAKSITTLDRIENPISKKVQEQYEEHPYPRWRYTNSFEPKNFFYHINLEITPNKIKVNKKFDNPNVLIAGCGTGNHSISTTRYKNANILAVDLSLSSLAYAKRKTAELGHNNIEYMQADILNLKKLNKKFDIIESSGVLHHMKDPFQGLKILVDILEPHGFLKLGLYSESGWQDVVETKKFINKKYFKNSSEDIRIYRQDIINENKNSSLQTMKFTPDFYSTSSVRDLLFHTQVHLFTIPQISKILKNLNLQFLGFINSDITLKTKFLRSFPEDKNNTSLDNWHQFEINNPKIFAKMYQFWIKKK